jgi:mannosylglycerate hydrolase
MMKKYKAILVSNTHWDREHSRPFEQFRWHLVYNVMDKLLEIMASDPEYRFMFDGQSLALRDYLEIRPERETEIEEHIRSGRLSVGPWLVGPDEFIPSGESLIRNLFFGHKIAMRYGGVMKVGYNPDAFGHIAQLPQILRGFGIQAVVFSRGMGDGIGKPGVDFLWEAPDESEIIATYHHYGNLAHLPTDPQEACERIGKTIDTMLHKEIPYLLLSNGSDGSPPQAHVLRIIQHANSSLEDVEIRHGDLQDYVDLVTPGRERLQRYRGELRWGKYNLILGGVYSSRMYLKQANARTQTLLATYAEPLATFAWATANDDYPAPFLNRAWMFLLENHFHDTICGCSRDEVYHDAMWRYARSTQISQKLIERSVKVLTRRISTDADQPNVNVTPLVVFNPLSWGRTEVVTKAFHLPVEADGKLPSGYTVRDASGKLIASQIRHLRVLENFQPSFWEKRYPTGKRICELDLSWVAEDVPPCGYKVYYASGRDALLPHASPSIPLRKRRGK